jgi:hypothetical protein
LQIHLVVIGWDCADRFIRLFDGTLANLELLGRDL